MSGGCSIINRNTVATLTGKMPQSYFPPNPTEPSGPLDPVWTPPQTHAEGRMLVIEQEAEIELDVRATRQTVGTQVVPGQGRYFGFSVTDESEYYVFSVNPTYGGLTKFACVMDVLWLGTKTLLTNKFKGQRIACSYPSQAGLTFAGQRGDGSKEHTLWFRLSDYTTPSGGTPPLGRYLLRVRGIPKEHPYFRIPVGQSGDATVSYWKTKSYYDYRINMRPSVVEVDKRVLLFAQRGYGDAASVFEWQFGDSTPDASGPAAVHVYTDPGLYTVTLGATIPGELAFVTTAQVRVVASLPNPHRFRWATNVHP